MILTGKSISLHPYSLELCHEFYQQYVTDPLMTECKYVYDKNKIDLYYQNKVLDASRRFFAVCQGGQVIGEIQLKYIDFDKGCGTLSIVLANDAVKNKGYGTEAELLLINYAFNTLKLHTIYADAVHRNTRSKHVLEKIGFTHTHDDEVLAFYRLEKPIQN